jgi:hypothetical protein
VGTGGITFTFSIYNEGDIGYPPNLSGSPKVQITMDSGAFSVDSQPSSPVSPGSYVDFTLWFNPPSTGPWSGSVSIPNNDADESPYTFALSGTGT